MTYLTHKEVLQRIAELNCGDNYKLVGFLLEHGVDVDCVTSTTISFRSHWSIDRKIYVSNHIMATMPAIRDYLGY